MEKELLVLYKSEKDGNSWCVYAGGIPEAEQEFNLMCKEDETLEEIARIWITKKAEILYYGI